MRVASEMIDALDPDQSGREGSIVEDRAATILDASWKAARIAAIENAYATPGGYDRLGELATNEAASPGDQIDSIHRTSPDCNAILVVR
jgi:hypothetical protein